MNNLIPLYIFPAKMNLSKIDIFHNVDQGSIYTYIYSYTYWLAVLKVQLCSSSQKKCGAERENPVLNNLDRKERSGNS